MKIHVWVPEFGPGVGGIQTFSRLLVRALRDLYPAATISVYSKNDTSFQVLGPRDASGEFVPFGWWTLPSRTVVFFATLFRCGLSDRPDLVITTHANFSPVAAMLRKWRSIPYLVVSHGIEVWEIPNRSIRAALRSADRLIAVSRFTREKIADALSIPPSRVEILSNTFRPERFIPGSKPAFLLKRYGLAADQPVILTVARLERAERYKGYDQVLRALSEVRAVVPEVKYILAGRGPDRARVVGLIKELGLESNVILAGYIPDHELSAHYNLCDVFAMPSKGEGFGIVFLEAMACGKPVIAGNKDGSVDAVLNGELGVLVDPDNLQELAEALVAVLAEVGSRNEKVESRNAKRGTSSKVRTMNAKVESKESGDAHNEKLPEALQNTFEIRDSTSNFQLLPSGVRIPEVIFHPEELRRRVIEAYGFEKFKERLAAILEPLLKS